MTIRRITKQEIRTSGLSGLPVYGEWVCRVKRGSKGLVLIERHNWDGEEDGRVLYAVKKASGNYALELSRKAGFRSVDIYSSDGCMLEQYTAEQDYLVRFPE